MNFDTSLFSKRRRITQNLMFTLFRIFSYSIVAILFFILGFIIVKGIGVISWDFITQAPSDGQQSGRYPVYCIRLVRYGILCQPTQFRRQHIGRFIDAGIACSTHHHSHNRRDVQRYPVLFQRRQYGLRGNQSTDHLESPASYGHSPDHYGTHTLAGTCLGRDSTYPVHLRSILFTEIADQYFRPVYGIALSSLCRCNQRNRCRSTTTDRLRNSICPHRHRLDNELSGQWYTELFR